MHCATLKDRSVAADRRLWLRITAVWDGFAGAWDARLSCCRLLRDQDKLGGVGLTWWNDLGWIRCWQLKKPWVVAEGSSLAQVHLLEPCTGLPMREGGLRSSCLKGGMTLEAKGGER